MISGPRATTSEVASGSGSDATTLPVDTAAPPAATPVEQRLSPLDARSLCDEQQLTKLTQVLWNRWFDDADANPGDAHPGYLLYAKKVLYEGSADAGNGPHAYWGMVPGTLMIWGWDQPSGLMAFAFWPNEPRSDTSGVAVVADANGLIATIDLHGPPGDMRGPSANAAEAQLHAQWFRSAPVVLDVWDGTTGRIAASCA